MAEKNTKIYNKGIVPRGDKFQKNLKLKGEVYSTLKNALESTSEKAFDELGFSQSDIPSGVYANKTAYGMGTNTGHYNIKIAGQTQTMLEKLVSFGTKRIFIEIHLDIQVESETLTIKYKNTEKAAFRGYNSDTGPMMINETLNFSLKDMKKFKKELNEKLSVFAKKEAAFITSTKMGNEDKVEKSTASIVEVKNRNLNSVFKGSDSEFLKSLHNEGKRRDPFSILDESFEMEDDREADNLLLSDELEESDFEDDFDGDLDGGYDFDFDADEAPYTGNDYKMNPNAESNYDDDEDMHADASVVGAKAKVTDMGDPYDNGGKSGTIISVVPPKRGLNKFANYVIEFQDGARENYRKSQLDIMFNEITSAGGAGSAGGFSYDEPIGKPNRRTMKRSYSDTEHAKRSRLNEEKGNWGPSLAEDDKGFWKVVSQDVLDSQKKNHIMGAPGAENIEINSEAEEEYNSGGVQKFPGGKSFKEGDFEKHASNYDPDDDSEDCSEDDLNEAKFVKRLNVEQANEHLKIDPSVSKRWKYQNQPTQEETNRRWKELSNFSEGETIRRAERVTEDRIEEPVAKRLSEGKEVVLSRNQDLEEGDVMDGQKIIKIQKKNRLGFNMSYMVAEKDYLNESKSYIHDYSSGVLIPNPNFRVKS